jgi:precorrin-8X/cobalt-precorrin-8 methylmutase
MPETSDLGARTPEAREISSKSRNIARRIVGDSGYEDRIRQRCVIATGDPEFAGLLQFKNDPIRAGIDAIGQNRDIYTDIRMVSVGITKVGHDCPVTCVLDIAAGEKLVAEYGITRTSAGFKALGHDLDGAIVVIGNAPSAALLVCELIESGISPALVVGTPVGFVNASESKELLHSMDVSSITCTGTRGGTPVAVACMNELIAIFWEENRDGTDVTG